MGGAIMTSIATVVHSNPDILGGAPVFVGTRVPVRALIDYLGGGQPLSEFLEDFPSVTREQAVAAQEQMSFFFNPSAPQPCYTKEPCTTE
jgi:uncharacterized protein (DUF433 family)